MKNNKIDCWCAVRTKHIIYNPRTINLIIDFTHKSYLYKLFGLVTFFFSISLQFNESVTNYFIFTYLFIFINAVNTL